MEGKWTAVKKINKSLLFAVTQMSQSIEPNRQAWSQWTGAASKAIKGLSLWQTLKYIYVGAAEESKFLLKVV